MIFCAVQSCNSRNEQGRTYHKFPSDPTRHKEWLAVLGYKNLKLKSSAVCSRHFRNKDYYPGGRRLLAAAIPSLRLNHGSKKEVNLNKSITTKDKTKDVPNKAKTTKKSSHSTPIINYSKQPVSSPKSDDKKKSKLLTTVPTPIKNHNSRILTTKSYSANPLQSNRQESSNSKSKKRVIRSTSLTKFKGGHKRSIDSTINEWSRAPFQNKSNESKEKKPRYSVPALQTKEKQLETFNPTRFGETVKVKNYKAIVQPEIQRNTTIRQTRTPQPTKRYIEEDIPVTEHKRRKKGGTCCETQDAKTSYSQVSEKNANKNQSDSVSKNNEIFFKGENIQQTILDMQNKIKKLEQKSILDEKKIETFKKALIEQREKDIKLFMDEKENELLLRMDLLYLDYDPHRICRLCLLLMDNKESLTSLMLPKNQPLILLIKNTTGVQIESEDNLPSGICSDCLQQIRRIERIRRRTQRSNTLIKKFLSMKKGVNENGDSSSPLPNDAGNEKIYFNDDFFEEEQTDVFKIEDVFSLENSPEVQPFDCMPLKQESEPIDEIIRIPSVKEPCIMQPKVLVKKNLKCKRCRTEFTNHWSLMNHYNYCNKKFKCFECNKSFWNNELFVMHKQRRYSCICPESKRCCFQCQIVFRWKWQLVFHVYLHTRQSCELCDEVFYSINQLKQHFTRSHFDC